MSRMRSKDVLAVLAITVVMSLVFVASAQSFETVIYEPDDAGGVLALVSIDGKEIWNHWLGADEKLLYADDPKGRALLTTRIIATAKIMAQESAKQPPAKQSPVIVTVDQKVLDDAAKKQAEIDAAVKP